MQKVNLFLSINEWCNLDCDYCNVYKTKKELSFSDIKKSIIYFLKFFKNKEGYNIFFIGGEPMLSFDNIKKSILFIKIIEQRLGKKISISMPSNGTLFTDKNLQFLKKYKINISLSIDTLNTEYKYRNIRGYNIRYNNISSNNILLDKLELFQNYSDILRIKAVIVPDMVNEMKDTFLNLKKLDFKFINMQPAHGIYWSGKDIDNYINNYIFIRDNYLDSNLRSATFKGSECSDKGCTSGCAKGKSEICIDSYGNIMVCDAFLAFDPEKRKNYAHDNLFNQKINKIKFDKYSKWKYCDNDIIGKENDLTNCETCNETKSCSTLCNAIPINGEALDKKILISNFNLYHKLDLLGI